MKKSTIKIALLLSVVMMRSCFPDPVMADSHIRTTSLSEICNTRTDTVRDVSEALKHKIYIRDNTPGGNHTGICGIPEGCEVDHLVSLELGGSNDAANLMIQPYAGICNAHQKDHLENKLHALVCASAITVKEAQTVIYSDWQAAFKKYVDPKGCE